MVDIGAFRLERFAEGQPIAGRHPYTPRRDHVEPIEWPPPPPR